CSTPPCQVLSEVSGEVRSSATAILFSLTRDDFSFATPLERRNLTSTAGLSTCLAVTVICRLCRCHGAHCHAIREVTKKTGRRQWPDGSGMLPWRRRRLLPRGVAASGPCFLACASVQAHTLLAAASSRSTHSRPPQISRTESCPEKWPSTTSACSM